MVWSPGTVAVEFRDVPQRHFFFNVALYTLLHFLLGTQKSNTILNNLFYMNIKFDQLLSEIDHVLQLQLIMSA